MIWVEVLSRHGDVAARERIDANTVTIGRAYDNDVVLDDPYTAAHHLRIERNAAGGLVAHDLGSVNGLYVGDEKRRQTDVELDGERLLHVGRTTLRIRDSAYAVAPERVAGVATRAWPTTLALIGAVLIASLLSLWLSETVEPQLSRYVLPLFALAVLVLVWTTAWALMSRIFSGASHFERHLTVALVGLLAFFVFDEITDYGSFAFSWRGLADYAYIGNWALLAALCYFHLREIGPMRLRVKGGAVAALALLAIGVQTLTKSELSSIFGQQSYLPALKPPMFRLKTPKSEGDFFADVERLKTAVDKSRKDPVESLGLIPEPNDEN